MRRRPQTPLLCKKPRKSKKSGERGGKPKSGTLACLPCSDVVVILVPLVHQRLPSWEKCVSLDLNPRPRSRSRRRWFFLSPRSEDTAVRVFQDPYQPMVIRARLALGPSFPRCFSSYKHARQTMVREFAGGGYSTVRCQPA